MNHKNKIAFLRVLLLALLMGLVHRGCTQPAPTSRPAVRNPEFDSTIAGLISFSVPLIGVEDLKNIQNEVAIFDARERAEYEVSHIPGARFLGYEKMDPNRLNGIKKDTPIVLYCSVGYRSEKIGEKLQQMGYTKVYNLYGSIFEWVNQGQPVVDGRGQPTPHLHTYNKKWSRWVDNPKVQKTW